MVLNPKALLTAALTALLIVLLMSFEDPLRVSLVALLLSIHGPVWRLIHALEPATAKAATTARART
ncbi:MAG: hypothetical protein DI570_16630 [Phenylobacterium zucineum]|nr:MAG: hypothetical protein DI570_16630 [Phenylobacterium zucineum]